MKKQYFKKIAVLACAAMTAASVLTGCGGTGETSTEEPGKGKLTILSWIDQKSFEPVLEKFKEKYPDMEIDFQNVPNEGNQYQQKLNLLATSEELPDVYWIKGPVTNFARNGYMKDITDMDIVKALPDTYTSDYSYDGKVYAYAPDTWVGGMFYNKDLYAEYGFEPPKDWDEFLEQSKAFMADGIKPLSMFGAALPDLIYWIHDTEDVAKDPTIDDKINSGEMTFSEVYGDAVRMWYEDCVKTGIVNQDMIGITDDQRIEEFATGKAAATLSGAWAIDSMKGYNPELNIGIVPFVGTEGNEYAMGAVNVGIAINSEAKNAANAQLFLEFMGSEEGLTLYQEVTGNFLGVEGIDYEIDPIMEPMKAFAESGDFQIGTSKWTYGDALDSAFQKGAQEMIMGTKTVDEVLQEMDEKMADLLATESVE